MERRSLSFKYWIEFDADGDIKSIHKNKYDCEVPCEEYVVKLIPIKRDITKELGDSVEKVAKTIKINAKKLDTEFKRVLKDAKRVLK